MNTTAAAGPAPAALRTLDPPDPTSAAPSAGGAAAAAARVPIGVLAALGERLAAGTAGGGAAGSNHDATAGPDEPPPGQPERAELERLGRLGLQLQELAHIVTRAGPLRQENVDVGLALLQTVAEWSTEAARLGVELHGPAQSLMVRANPAALKHLMDLMVEHALTQGRAVHLEIERPVGASAPPWVTVLAKVSSEAASEGPRRDTLAWLLVAWLAQALGVRAVRTALERGERLAIVLPAAAG